MALSQLLVLAAATTVMVVTAESYGYAPHPPPYASSYGPHKYEDYPSYDRDYSFNYGVKDDYTYNYQTRDEVKKGNTVYGSYSVVEPDGNLRVVNYEADDYGFRATVDREGVVSPYGVPSASYQSSGPAYKAAPYQTLYKSPAPYVAAPVVASYKTSYKVPAPVYADPAPYPGPYKTPARAHIYDQPKLASIYKAPANYIRPGYNAAPTYNHHPTAPYAKAPIYANHRAPSYSVYKAGTYPAPVPYKGAGRGSYKAPTYNYDDEY